MFTKENVGKNVKVYGSMALALISISPESCSYHCVAYVTVLLSSFSFDFFHVCCRFINPVHYDILFLKIDT